MMDTNIVFSVGPLTWATSGMKLVLLGLAALVFAWVIARARARLSGAAPGRRTLVTGLHGLALLGLTLLVMPPGCETTTRQSAVLVTEGGNKVTGAGPVYTLNAGLLADAANTEPLLGVGQLLVKRPQLTRLVVSGHGLSAAEWSEIPSDISVEWQAAEVEGLVDLGWSAVLEGGDELVVTGALEWRDTTALLTVRLMDPAGLSVDRMLLRSGEQFGLRALPRTAGPISYRLQLLDGDRVVSDDPVPVYVRSGRLARIQIFQSAPSFESRQLANWATDRGAELVISTQVSRERDLLQRINAREEGAQTAPFDLLGESDLLLIDGRRWVAFSDSERSQVITAVAGGLGLVLAIDEELASWLEAPDAQALLGVQLAPQPEPTTQALAPRLLGEVMPLPVAPWRVALGEAQTLTRSSAGAVLESWRSYGEGRIAVSRLRERHRWATTGDRSTFTRYWARMLSMIGRADQRPFWMSPVAPSQLRTGVRAEFCVSSPPDQVLSMDLQAMESAASAPVSGGVSSRAVRLPLTLSSVMDTEACGLAWPTQPGWHRLRLLGEADALMDEVWVRVLDVGEAVADRMARRQVATRQRLATAPELSAEIGQSMSVALSPWWGWGLLLVSLVPLWLERRLFDLA